MASKFRFVIILLVLNIVLALPAAAQVDTINLGEIRVVNALTGMGAVDVYLDNAVIAYALPPEQATTYFVIPSGKHTLTVRLPGAQPLSAPVADILIDLPANNSKTAVVYQKQFASPQGETGLYVPPLEQSGAFMVLDDNRSPTQLGKTRLTAVHLFPARPGQLNVAYTNRASLLHEVGLERDYGSIDIDAGNYPLLVVDAESADLDIIERIGQVTFQANTLYTMVIVPNQPPPSATDIERGIVRPGPLVTNARVFILRSGLEAPGDGMQVRVIHAAHDTAVVDLYVDERLIAPRMNYGQHTEYMGLNGYSHTITLRGRDASPQAQPLATARLNITEDNRGQTHWTLLLLNANPQTLQMLSALNLIEDTGPGQEPSQIINTPGGPLVMTLLPDNIAQTQRGRARVRLIHAVDGALDLSLRIPRLPSDDDDEAVAVGPTPTPSPPIELITPVVYGAEANEAETPGGVYPSLDFIVGSTTNILSIPSAPLIDGVVYTLVLTGRPAGEPPVQALWIENYGRGIPQERLYRGFISATVEVVNIRERDTLQSSPQGQINNGAEVEVLGRNIDGSWVLIRYTPIGRSQIVEGWISAPLIRVTRLGDAINVLSLPLVQR